MEHQSMLTDPFHYAYGAQYGPLVRPIASCAQYRPFVVPHRSAELGSADLHHGHYQQRIPHHPAPPSYAHEHTRCSLSHVRPQAQQNMAYMQSEQDLAEFQTLSNNYEPEALGPLVSVRKSTSAITTEYASADPVYQAKTAALPQRYSFYRTCRGDGRCGWRAIAFGYMESLVRLNDRNRFFQEESRLKSLRNVWIAAGNDPEIIEDFEVEVVELLRRTAATLQSPNVDAEAALLQELNTEHVQDYLITYLRTLTSSWIQTRPDDYAQFVLPKTLQQFCEQDILPHTSEIDSIGITALAEVLLKPAGISLEIIYLDRSEGSEANVHHYGPTANGRATIRLLYRPGHYDVLYKADDVFQADVGPAAYFQHASHYDTNIHQIHEPHIEPHMQDFMSMIPGFSIVPGLAEDYNGFYQQSSIAPGSLPLHQLSESPTVSPHAPTVPQYSLPQYMPLPPESSSDCSMSMPSMRVAGEHEGDPYKIRFSSHMLQMRRRDGAGNSNMVEAPAPCPEPNTAPFKNSAFNPAHYRNHDFSPEHYDPSSSNQAAPKTRRSGRHRSS